VAARVPWERRAPFYFVFFCLKNCSFYFVVWRIPLLFLEEPGFSFLIKLVVYNPSYKDKLETKRKLHPNPCKNPRSFSSPMIGAIYKADHHTDKGNKIGKTP